MRCKSCDKPLKENEIIWREDLHEHETLCLSCRRQVFGTSEEDLETLDMLDVTKDGDLFSSEG